MLHDTLSDTMATEERRRRPCDQSRSGRLVIGVQIVSWCAVGALLVLRGITTLYDDSTPASANNYTSSVIVMNTNSSQETPRTRSSSEIDGNYGTAEEETVAQQNEIPTVAPKKKTAYNQQNLKNIPKLNPSSAILITVGGTMLIIGPILLLARIVDSRRNKRKEAKFSKVDPPPSYDEVVDKVPRYSALFQITDSGELVPLPTNNEGGTSSTSVPV